MVGGPGGGGAPGRYSLNVSINVQNLFNHVNLRQPEGNISSPNFGESLGLSSFGGFGGAAVAVQVLGTEGSPSISDSISRPRRIRINLFLNLRLAWA